MQVMQVFTTISVHHFAKKKAFTISVINYCLVGVVYLLMAHRLAQYFKEGQRDEEKCEVARRVYTQMSFDLACYLFMQSMAVMIFIPIKNSLPVYLIIHVGIVMC